MGTEGAVNYPITVTASAIPPPAYQWQKLVTIEVNTTTNSTTNSTGAGKRDEEYHVRPQLSPDLSLL